jgi:hypothetical protein
MAKRVMARVDAADCVAALRASFSPPGYAFFEQVANGTGWAAKRWADAIAMGIWPSRGLLIHGFEIKVSRTDWKKELEHPEKAEQIQSYCDRWWVVAPRGMLDRSELPPTWGLYEINEKKKGHVLVAAPELAPKPLSKTFVAAILRRHSEAFEKIVARERHDAKEEGALNGAGVIARRLEAAETGRAELLARIEEFEQKSGVTIAEWNLGNVADAVRLLIRYEKRSSLIENLTRDAEAYETRAEGLRAEIAALASVSEVAAE